VRLRNPCQLHPVIINNEVDPSLLRETTPYSRARLVIGLRLPHLDR